MEKSKILEKIKSLGIVGAGGAGFPTYMKLNTMVDTVIANAAECEPLLYSDKDLMKKHPAEFMTGLKHVVDITGAQRGIIGIKGCIAAIILEIYSCMVVV